MKNIKITIFVFLFSVLLSCNAKSSEEANGTLNGSIPEEAIPFEYDFKLKKAILIPGTLNDSIPLRYWLETGSEMGFSDSLDSWKKETSKIYYNVERPMLVQIGQWKHIYGDSIIAYFFDKNNFIFKWLGYDIALLPWKFFDKKIVEISFSRQYIRELSDTKNLSGYDSVKMKIQGRFLTIPIVVKTQGKRIVEFVSIDTGYNGDVSFGNNIVSKYNIKSDSAYFGKSQNIDRLTAGFSFPIDTIQVGKNFVTDGHHVSFSLNKSSSFALIGNKFFENFDIVLDLKDYCLYLKPIEKC